MFLEEIVCIRRLDNKAGGGRISQRGC